MSTEQNEIEKIFGNITVDKIIDSQSTTSNVALVKQVCTTSYPGARGGNSMGDSLFDTEEFGGENQEFSSDRYALVKCPKDATVESVQAKIDAIGEEARLYRILSLDIDNVLTDEQKSAMANNVSEKTLDEYKESKMVRDEEENEVPYNGQPQYRSIYFAKTPVEDIDLRQEEFAVIRANTERLEVTSEVPVKEKEKV